MHVPESGFFFVFRKNSDLDQPYHSIGRKEIFLCILMFYKVNRSSKLIWRPLYLQTKVNCWKLCTSQWYINRINEQTITFHAMLTYFCTRVLWASTYAVNFSKIQVRGLICKASVNFVPAVDMGQLLPQPHFVDNSKNSLFINYRHWQKCILLSSKV